MVAMVGDAVLGKFAAPQQAARRDGAHISTQPTKQARRAEAPKADTKSKKQSKKPNEKS
jgi:hypothetical protein